MNTTKYKCTVTKGNDRGAGFIRIPLQIRNKFCIKDQYKATINSKIRYYCKIRDYRGKGIFVPVEINVKNRLYKKEVDVELEKIDGFYTKVGSDGRIYVPNTYPLKKGDIISISIKINGEKLIKYPKIYLRKKKNTKELIFYLDKSFYNKEVIIKVDIILQKNKLVNSKHIFNKLLKNFDFAEIETNKIIVYYGNRVPIMVNNNIDIKNLAHYLGCYFADGTKKGNDWGICASTFKQADYFINKHKEIISNPNIIPSITCTAYNIRNIEKLKEELISIWSKKLDLNIKGKSVRIIKTETEYASNRGPYGSLSMKEHRQLTQIYYNRLLKYLFDCIIKESNKDLATDFICGAMEGDGCLNSKKHGHIIITTNINEIKILKEICDKSHFISSIRFWKGKKNRIDLVIGSLQITKNISILKDKLFKYYPKRRKILKERLAQTGCARFLLGKSKKTSNWLIGKLKTYEILDSKGNLTKFGKKIQKDLKEFLLSKD
jgi:hypothetical protein